jgi:hypothetical protein
MSLTLRNDNAARPTEKNADDATAVVTRPSPNGANLGFEAQLFLAADKLRILATTPLGSVGYEAEANERSERLVWLDHAVLARLRAMRAAQIDAHDCVGMIGGQCHRGPKQSQY